MPGSPSSSVRGGFPLDLTGATAATRYVGATASGAPVAGTFAVGDFVIDQAGKVWVCTVAGTPGTWVQAGGGVTEHDYVEITADVTVASSTAGAPTVIITGNAVAYDGLTRVKISAYTPFLDIDTDSEVRVVLMDGASILGWLMDMTGLASGATTNYVGSAQYAERYLTPTAAAHTYKVAAYKTGGTAIFYAGNGASGSRMPAFLRITTA